MLLDLFLLKIEKILRGPFEIFEPLLSIDTLISNSQFLITSI
jgi:hypothetical protein